MFKKILLRLAKKSIENLLKDNDLKGAAVKKIVKSTRINDSEAGILYDLIVDMILSEMYGNDKN